jgi:hypothetical protein
VLDAPVRVFAHRIGAFKVKYMCRCVYNYYALDPSFINTLHQIRHLLIHCIDALINITPQDVMILRHIAHQCWYNGYTLVLV